MSKQFKTVKDIQKSNNQDQQAQNLDLRLRRQMKITSKYQLQLNQCKSLLQYCVQFLEKLKGQHENMKKHYLLDKNNPFGGWQAKIMQLTAQAKSIKSAQNRINNEKEKIKQVKQVACSQKKHLQEILDKNIIKKQEEQVRILEEKLNLLHSKIQGLVMNEYINEKIVNKIRKQSRRAAKIKTTVFLQKQISKYKNWVEENNAKLNNKMIVKQVEQKIMFNLEMMKLIMNKKITNNDFIYEQFVENQLQNFQVLEKIDRLSQQIHQKYSISIQSIKQRSLNQQPEQIFSKQHVKIGKSLKSQTIKNYFTQVETIIQKLENYAFEQEIMENCTLTNSKLDQLLISAKK